MCMMGSDGPNEEAIHAVPASELDRLIDEWEELVSHPQQPVPGWQLIIALVGEILHRARDGRLVYAEDFRGAANMVEAAGKWRVEMQSGDPYADWRARALPLFARIAEGLPNRPVELQARRVGERIRSRREAAGLTQQQLGQRVGVSFETVSRWERNVLPPSRRHREQLAAELGGHASEYDADREL